MCKILCLTSHDPAKRDEIILKVWKHMSGTPDGYGAAWISPAGEIGYYRRSTARIFDGARPEWVTKPNTYAKAVFGDSNDVPSDGGFLIIHGRNATNDVCLENTHPMLAEGAAMVHNGMVRSDKYENTGEVTCDSQLLLQAYLADGIDEVEKEIEGYYAFMLLLVDLEDKSKRSLHIAKDMRAQLRCGILPNGAYAFATEENMLPNVGAEPMGDVEDKTLLVFEEGATAPQAFQFTPKPYTAFTKWDLEQERKTGVRPGKTYQHPTPTGSEDKGKAFSQSDFESDEAKIEAFEREMIAENVYAG